MILSHTTTFLKNEFWFFFFRQGILLFKIIRLAEDVDRILMFEILLLVCYYLWWVLQTTKLIAVLRHQIVIAMMVRESVRRIIFPVCHF